MDDQAKRLMLFTLVACVIIFTFSNKQQQKQSTKPGTEQQGTTSPFSTGTLLTSQTATALAQPTEFTPQTPQTVVESDKIVVRTGTYEVTFDTLGAAPTSWKVIDPEFAMVVQEDIDAVEKQNAKLPKGAQEKVPVIRDFKAIELIPQYSGLDQQREYPLMVVLKEQKDTFHNFNNVLYKTDGPKVVYGDDGSTKTINLILTSNPDSSGLQLEKSFTFEASGYLTHVQMRLRHHAEAPAALSFTDPNQPGLGLLAGPGIGRAHYKSRWDSSYYKIGAYNGDEIESENFSDWEDALEEQVMTKFITDDAPWRWGMLDSRFYAGFILPEKPAALIRGIVKSNHVPFADGDRKNMVPPSTLEVYSDGFRIHPGEEVVLNYNFFLGPKKRSLLAEIDKTHEEYNLRGSMYQSNWWLSRNIIRPVAVFMLWLMVWFYELTSSYGIAIILVVLVMRMLTQPFTHMGMKSQARVMAEQKRVKPFIDAINEKFKDDPQKRNAEVWKTYREHGVNPLGMLKGCGWMLVQMPIFFALYRLLMTAVELRGQGFLWIADLTAPDALFTLPFAIPLLGDKFNILPILMGVSQVFAQRLQSTNVQDPMQKQMMTFMPIMFIFMLYNFAAGLSLYWFVSNLWQITFQVFVNKKVKEEAEAKAVAAFDARQKDKEKGNRKVTTIVQKSRKKKPTSGKPSWREKLMAKLEEAAKEAENRQQQAQKKKKKK